MSVRVWLVLVLGACAHEAAPPPPVTTALPLNRGDPEAVARALLEAYRVRDLDRLGDLAVAKERAVFAEIRAEGARHPRHATLFGGWRYGAVRAWEGDIEDVRYLVAPGLPPQARVRFGLGPDGRVHVAVLAFEEGEWRFEDLSADRPEHYRALPGALR